MNGYQPSTPRPVLAFAAVAMAAITLGAMVVLPAKFDSLGVDPYALAAERAAGTAPKTAAADGDTAPRAAVSDRAPAAVAAGAGSVTADAAPAGAASDTSLHAGRTILDTQDLDGKRRKVSLRSRTRT